MILKSLYALLASLGFGVLFNIKGKNLVFASIGGFLTWYVYLLILNLSASNLLGLFVASLAAGLYSEALARILKSPVTTFSICSIIPLVPGGGMYYTMLESVQGNINKFLSTGLDTLSNAGAIAVGILLASSVTKVILIIERKKTSRIH
ncbi:threonine/serine exporter family protein [Clostridium swellfunianum]|uniref:threonine/serine exporter family protein n=1 Tax=Clostridium swellfunianum TaxID=1367462 RepID=UPI00202E9EC2|nr:threonine/serine exporter family protein [Clostridium swellfunianum]MCM0648789.1 threonine/serine exporter family protein [Clostridium swellfunianum]